MSTQRSWLRFAAAILLGSAIGLAAFTATYADVTSYLRDDPTACANCHVMQGHLDAWIKSSHGKFAGCNDCHAPHTNVVEMYYSKSRNGFFHSLAFTTGNFQENLRATPYNLEITEAACRSCHTPLVHEIDAGVVGAEGLSCIRCHSTVGHDR